MIMYNVVAACHAGTFTLPKAPGAPGCHLQAAHEKVPQEEAPHSPPSKNLPARITAYRRTSGCVEACAACENQSVARMSTDGPRRSGKKGGGRSKEQEGKEHGTRERARMCDEGENQHCAYERSVTTVPTKRAATSAIVCCTRSLVPSHVALWFHRRSDSSAVILASTKRSLSKQWNGNPYSPRISRYT